MRSLRAATALIAFCLLAPAGAAAASNGGVAFAPPVVQPAPPVQPVAPAPSGKLVGFIAHAPHGAPVAVRRVIAAGNSLQTFPYRYGGGHASFKDKAYDCSGTVSFALHGAGLVTAPLDSTGFMTWGLPGPGSWVTVYANKGHAFLVVAGLRLDTSGTGGSGPRWRALPRSTAGFVARHPAGL